ncbi:hypothetical protein EDF71_108141 [Comamonas sp. JUb58]|nr:hypothetical protein EDF71_108141 [Comamonas sp. JUb58]
MIESAFLQVLQSGQTPSCLHLTEDGLQELRNDPTLGTSWSPGLPDWQQKVLGLPLQRSLAHNAIEVEGRLVLLGR